MLPVMRLFRDRTEDWEFHSLWQNGTDAFTKAFVRGDGFSASLKTGIGAKSCGELVITGTEGFLKVEAPWWKTSAFSAGFEDPQKIKSFRFSFEGDGLRYEIADFLCRIRGDQSRAFKLLPEDSIRMAGVYEQFTEYRRKYKDGPR